MDWQHLFVAWGLWWWLLTLAFLVGSFALVAWKRGAYFLISLVAYLGLVQFLGNTPVLEFLQSHYSWIIGLVGGFLLVAIFWFNWRWHWFTSKMRGRYDHLLSGWLQEKGLEVLSSNVTLITGPSKTGDIELQLTTGVHGPGKWWVIVVR